MIRCRAPLAIVGDSNTFFGDTLTLNGEPGGNNFVITGFTIDGAGATISYATIETLTVNGTGGTNTFTVNGTSIPTYLNGASGSDTFIVNSNSAPLYLAGGAGDDTFTINGNSSPLVATGDAGNDTFTINGNSGGMNLSGGDDNDTFTVNGSSGGSVLSANGDAGNDTFTINALSSPATLNGGAGDDSFTVNTPLAATPMIIGGGGTDSLTLNGSVGNDFWVITNNSVGGVGSPVSYSDLDVLIVNGISGNDTFNVRSTSAATTLNTGTGMNTINVGSTAPVTGGIVDGIQGAVTIVGYGNDVLNIDDTGSVLDNVGALTSNTLTGLGMGDGGITFSGISVLNLGLGSGNDTLTIVNTPSVTANIDGNNGNDTFNVQGTTGITNLDGGAGNDTFNLGSLTPAVGDNVNSIAGQLNIDGSVGSDVINVDDTGDTAANTGLLTLTRLTGLGLGTEVNYIGVESLNINLGSGDDTFNIQSTNSAATTTLTSGAGCNVITVGSLAPATGGMVNDIFGVLVIVGHGSDTLNVDNSGDVAGNSGALTPTTITGLGMASGITYSGLAVLNITLGSGDDTFTVNDMTNTTVTTIDGGFGSNSASLNFAGDFGAQNLTLLNFQTATLSVVGNFTGLLNDAEDITTASIGGAFTSTGILNAGSIDTMTVGGDFAGLLNVTGLLNSLAIGGGAPGKVVAGDVNFITVQAGYGNKVLQVIEGGIERQVQAIPVAGGILSNTIQFTLIYDSSAAGDPQLAIEITNNGTVVPHSFDLVLASYSSNAKFNLALVFSNGQTGVSNIAVSGDILTTVSSAELNFFGLAGRTHSGVSLPLDNITGVEVSGRLPIGVVDVAGIEGIAFAVLTTVIGKPVNILGDLVSTGKSSQVLWNLLGSKPTILPAVDAFRVPFNENHSVRLYAQSNPNSNLEYVMTLTDQIADGAPMTAIVRVQPTATGNGNPALQSVNLFGDGGSLDTVFSLANLTSTGALGDVTVRGFAGLGNVTAPNIIGNINVVKGGITGTIQTTGIRIDPFTGAETAVNADLGQLIIKNGKVVGITTISSKLAITGQIISRGDLISSITTGGALSGVIAAQGNIGAVLTDSEGNAITKNGKLTRFGGITIKGNDSGEIIALGNIFGNLTINGQLTGRIAAKGAAVSGLDSSRSGILGNIKVTSAFSATAAVVSGGVIGDAAGRTTFSCGAANGCLAADGSINLAKKVPASNVFANSQGTANGAAIDAVFTDASVPLQISNGAAGLTALVLIGSDLNALQISDGSLAGTTP